jgi:hypothetical protein
MNFLIPQSLLFGDGLPACLAHTWLQLRCLAGESELTPPLPALDLSRLTGKSLATLYRHLRRLKMLGLLDWRCRSAGLQVSFVAASPIPAAQAAPLPAAHPSDVPASAGFTNLNRDSQICNRASLNTLTDSLVKLTRVEAQFAELSAGSILGFRSKIPSRPVLPQEKMLPRATLSPPADDPLTVYRRLARLTPNPAQRDLLLQRVHDLPRWRETLEHWLAHRWNPRNLPGMLELYQRGGASGCRYCPKPLGSKAGEAFQQLRQQYAAEKPALAIPETEKPALWPEL